MEQFLELVAEALEVEREEISMETDFREDIEDFSSLMGFSLIVMMEDEYGVQVTVEEFLNSHTIEDLYRRCIKE